MINTTHDRLGRGIDLAAECAYVGQWSEPRADDAGVIVTNGRPAIPPAALIPRFDEPLRSDMCWPPHPRGSGRPWPPEARVDDAASCGRLPMAIAWRLLQTNHDWTWSIDSTRLPISGADAIGAVVRDACGSAPSAGERSPAVLVIPNTLSETHQQQLVDAGRAEGLDIKLLWRPIAAAIAWCNRRRPQLQEHPRGTSDTMGKLLVLHVGFDVFEATVLDIVPRDKVGAIWFLPARHRPDKQRDVTNSFGFTLLTNITRASLQNEGHDPTIPAIWERMWCTSWLRCLVECLAGQSDEGLTAYKMQVDPSVDVAALNDRWRSQVSGLAGKRVGGQTAVDDVGQHRGDVGSGDSPSVGRIGYKRPCC